MLNFALLEPIKDGDHEDEYLDSVTSPQGGSLINQQGEAHGNRYSQMV